MSRTVIYYSDSSLFGGVERAILQHIEGLDRSVWQPVLVHHPQAEASTLLQEAVRLNARLVEMPALPLGLSGARQLPAFMAMLRSERPAVFHAHLSWPLACKWGMVAALFARVPAVVATLHLWVEAPYATMARWQQNLITAKSGKYIAVSDDIARKLKQVFNVSDTKLQIIHSAVKSQRFMDANKLAPPAEIQRFRGRPIILTVARLDQQKDLPTLLEAAALVPEAVFFFVGEGPERTTLESQSHQLGLENRVVFAGFQADIAAWMGHCSLFVLPSLYEGLPISLLEAMACGKPVIASDIPGNDEAVTHGKTGWLFPPGDAVALSGAIRLLLADHDLAQRLATAGQAHVQSEFSTEAMNQRVMRVYTELLEKKHDGRYLNA